LGRLAMMHYYGRYFPHWDKEWKSERGSSSSIGGLGEALFCPYQSFTWAVKIEGAELEAFLKEHIHINPLPSTHFEVGMIINGDQGIAEFVCTWQAWGDLI